MEYDIKEKVITLTSLYRDLREQIDRIENKVNQLSLEVGELFKKIK